MALQEEFPGLISNSRGLIEIVPEMKALISELNDLLAHDAEGLSKQFSSAESTFVLEDLGLTAPSAAVATTSNDIREHCYGCDPHGNVQVSRIETEKLLIGMVEVELAARKAAGSYVESSFSQNHFFGYEGRCAAPSNFDADYCYRLGYTASALLGAGKTACNLSLS